MKSKPKIFIGSSVESLEIARAIQNNLDYEALCNVWDQGIFELSGNALENLIEATHTHDFAIFVFMHDDIIKIREKEYFAVRDNLVFELGLFISRLGKDKVFFLIPRNTEKLHLPTDLIGIQPGHFEIPLNQDDLPASLGPFCNKIRIILGKSGQEEEKAHIQDTGVKDTDLPETETSEFEKLKSIEHGVSVDKFGNYKISVAPSVFFSNRISKAFPGIRGLEWFNNSEKALDRLEILLKSPLSFEKAIGHGVSNEPVWWSRGFSDLPILSFKRISDKKCIMDIEELEIDKIAVFNSTRYWQSFIYVEVKAEKQIGLYNYSDEEINTRVEEYGYFSEEYGLFDGIPITRACLDDGAAEINGKVIDTSGAELRVRYLSKYNFLISSRFSPIDCSEFENYSEVEMNKILKGQNTVENLLEFIIKLPKNENDD